MKNTRIIIILFIIFVLMIIFLSGPEVSMEYSIKEYNVPDDIDEYLRISEAKYSNIRPGTEKKIFWANPQVKDRTQFSIIYLHGFSATRRETSPLSNIVSERLNANLFYTRLTGHGRDGQALSQSTVNDWLNDTVEAITIGRRLGKKIIVIGASTGGTLATWLADHDRSGDIAGYILISPNYGPKNRMAEILTWPWAEYFVPLIIGETRSWQSENDMHMKYWTTSYPSVSLLPMMGLVKLVRQYDFVNIEKPFLFIFSPDDKNVEPQETEIVFSKLGSLNKKKYYVKKSGDPSNHLIAGDVLSPENNELIAGVILKFIKSTGVN